MGGLFFLTLTGFSCELPEPQNEVCSVDSYDVTNDSSCEDRLDATLELRECAAEQSEVCVTDADCTTVWASTQCQGNCQDVIHINDLINYEMTVQNINTTFCDGYIGDGCPYMTPSCMPIVAKCNAGVCVGEPEPFGLPEGSICGTRGVNEPCDFGLECCGSDFDFAIDRGGVCLRDCSDSPEGSMCGGIAGFQCADESFECCGLDPNIADASGWCYHDCADLPDNPGAPAEF